MVPPGVDPDGEWRTALLTRYPLVRRFIRLLTTTIEFGATTDAAPVLYALTSLPDLLDADATRRVPAGCLDARKVAIEVITPGWRDLVLRKDRPAETVDKVAYVFCVLDQFHQRLRRRDIFAAASSRWADPRALLLSGAAWQARRADLLDSLQLPDDPADLLIAYAAELDGMWKHMARRVEAGDVTVDGEGRVRVAAVKAVPEPDSLGELRKRCEAMIPEVDIGELLLEVMGWQPGFAAAYTHVSGGARLDAGMDRTLAAVLTAQALNVGWKPVITAGNPALTRSRISHVYQNYVRADTHAVANAVLISGQAGIGTAEVWGGGLVAAVDGTRFVVPVRSIHARPNPKYFGRKRGATYLNMINNQGVGIAGMVLSGTPKDSLYAVDLMYRRDGGPRPEVFVSDTGSYSDMVFGLLKLLGVDYRPELAGLPDQKLWRVNPSADYGPLNTAARGKIDLAKVRRHWPDICRIAASVHSGAISASDVMRMLQHGGNPTQLGDAVAHFGRIFKTLHVLSYADREGCRRDIKRIRNLQEERHGLAKHVFHGRKGELREAYHAGMEDQLGAPSVWSSTRSRCGTPSTWTGFWPHCAPTATRCAMPTSPGFTPTGSSTSTSTATTASPRPTSTPTAAAPYGTPSNPTRTTPDTPGRTDDQPSGISAGDYVNRPVWRPRPGPLGSAASPGGCDGKVLVPLGASRRWPFTSCPHPRACACADARARRGHGDGTNMLTPGLYTTSAPRVSAMARLRGRVRVHPPARLQALIEP